jgi:uncharacterized membrane protein
MLANGIVIVHVLAVFVLVAGIMGRNVLYARAARATDLSALRTLVDAGSFLEHAFVRGPSFLVLLAGLAAAWARGWPILGFLQGGAVNWVLASLVLYLAIIPVIVFVFVPAGNRFRKALAEADAQGNITPELTATLETPAVKMARMYESLMILVLTILMVTKPF